MEANQRFGILADDAAIKKTVSALTENGFEAIVVDRAEDAKAKVLELVPEGAQVMTMTSLTLDTIGVTEEINESGRYDAVKPKLFSMDKATQGREMRQLGAAPDWALGSVHAVTQDGQVVIASATGSQLPAHAYGAGQVAWVVGAQKLVTNLDDAMRRVYEYSFPLEDERALKAYGIHSSVNKLLILNKEGAPGRVTIIIIKEKLGF